MILFVHGPLIMNINIHVNLLHTCTPLLLDCLIGRHRKRALTPMRQRTPTGCSTHCSWRHWATARTARRTAGRLHIGFPDAEGPSLGNFLLWGRNLEKWIRTISGRHHSWWQVTDWWHYVNDEVKTQPSKMPNPKFALQDFEGLNTKYWSSGGQWGCTRKREHPPTLPCWIHNRLVDRLAPWGQRGCTRKRKRSPTFLAHPALTTDNWQQQCLTAERECEEIFSA